MSFLEAKAFVEQIQGSGCFQRELDAVEVFGGDHAVARAFGPKRADFTDAARAASSKLLVYFPWCAQLWCHVLFLACDGV